MYCAKCNFLTKCGKFVFQLHLKGLSNKQIREFLCISYNDVRRHKEKMLHVNKYKSIIQLVSLHKLRYKQDSKEEEEK